MLFSDHKKQAKPKQAQSRPLFASRKQTYLSATFVFCLLVEIRFHFFNLPEGSEIREEKRQGLDIKSEKNFVLCKLVSLCRERERERGLEMEMVYYQLAGSSYQDSLEVLEADIQHANALANAIPRAKGGARLQMKLVYNQLAPLFLFLLQWMDCSCTCLLPRYLNLFHILVYKVYTDGRPNISMHGRKATIKDFYAVILPSLQRLHGSLEELKGAKEWNPGMENSGRKRLEGSGRLVNVDLEREDECGICLEPCTKMVLPNCCHAMCIKCYRNWNTKSESCPFCRGSLKRVNSEDLWVLTCNDDVVDNETVSKEDLLRFYLYVNSLPKDYPDALFLVYYEYLI